jgi:hypothetical protein
MKALMALVMTLTLLTGCLATSGTPASQEAQTQHEAAVAALESYCNVVTATDSEVSKVCATVMPIALVSKPAVQLALELIFNILAKRELAKQAETARAAGAECHSK